MRIQFCDLCNESVPQGDLDDGRAVQRQGRLICASCEAAMSGAGGAEAPPAGEGEAPVLEFVSEMPAAGVPAAPVQSTATNTPHRHPRSARQTPALVGFLFVTFCAVALGLVGGGAYYFDKSEVRNARLQRDLEESEVRAATRAQELETRLADAVESRDAERGATLERVEELARHVASLGDAQVQFLSEQRKELDAQRERRAAGDDLAGSLETQRLELVRLATTVAELHADVLELGSRVESSRDAPVRLSIPEPEPVERDPVWYAELPKLKSGDPGRRWEAVTALGATADAETAPYLVPMLTDTDIFVRMATARILGDLGATESIPALIDTLEDEEASVREAAVISLRTISGREFKFRPDAKENERAKRIRAWRAWWEDARTDYGM